MKRFKYPLAAAIVALVALGVIWADTTTSRWGLTKPDIGSTNWGPKLNTNSDTIDDAAGQGKANTYTGSNTFNGATTIGAGSSSSLTISTNVTLSNTPNITGNANINTSSVTATNLSYTNGTGSVLTLSTITVNRTATLSTVTVSGYVSASSVTATNMSISNLNAASVAANIVMNTHKLTGLAAGSANGESVRFEQLKVLSIPSVGTTTTSSATTSSSFVPSNTTVTITPSSPSSKILIFACGTLHVTANNHSAFASLYNGTTNLLSSGGQAELLSTAAGSWWSPFTLIAVDSPNSGSAQTYTVRIRNDDNATSVSVGDTGVQSTIIAIEISGS